MGAAVNNRPHGVVGDSGSNDHEWRCERSDEARPHDFSNPDRGEAQHGEGQKGASHRKHDTLGQGQVQHSAVLLRELEAARRAGEATPFSRRSQSGKPARNGDGLSGAGSGESRRHPGRSCGRQLRSRRRCRERRLVSAAPGKMTRWKAGHLGRGGLHGESERPFTGRGAGSTGRRAWNRATGGERAPAGRPSALCRADPRSELNFNYIRVRSFVLSGAPTTFAKSERGRRALPPRGEALTARRLIARASLSSATLNSGLDAARLRERAGVPCLLRPSCRTVPQRDQGRAVVEGLDMCVDGDFRARREIRRQTGDPAGPRRERPLPRSPGRIGDCRALKKGKGRSHSRRRPDLGGELHQRPDFGGAPWPPCRGALLGEPHEEDAVGIDGGRATMPADMTIGVAWLDLRKS